jgi:V/A-type H+-transporting ATPase subunit I
MGFGGLLILLFSGHGKKFGSRLLSGVMALARLSGAFGDILSYLRLFALGLASASLAVTFNQLARDIAHSVPGAGLLFAFLIILVGHALNFSLAVVSGFIHGLRLNFIEFFNWSMYEEGKPFRPFAKKGGIKWKHSS